MKRDFPFGDEGDESRPRYYRLNPDHSIEPVDMMTWAEAFELPTRIIARSKIKGVQVSTVFLGLDHGFPPWEDTPYRPVLFETMIFGGKIEYQVRCCTWNEAVAQHAEACESAAEEMWAHRAFIRYVKDWHYKLERWLSGLKHQS